MENQDIIFQETVNKILKDNLVVSDEDQHDIYLFGWNIIVMCYNLGEYQLAIETYNKIDNLLITSKKHNEENKRSKKFKKMFKNCIEGTNFITILKYNNYRNLYNPYLWQIDEIIKSIKVGNHQFPVDIEKKGGK